jgi:hypothetical protein
MAARVSDYRSFANCESGLDRPVMALTFRSGTHQFTEAIRRTPEKLSSP